MDKIRQQKLREFLTETDVSIKEMKNYLMLENGGTLIDAIKKFEEENAEFLQYYPEGQEALNQRKCIIDFLLFPIISDDKVSELLQYKLLTAFSAGLDIDDLMRQRAISTSELIWPKLSQEYLKALTQNTELIGSSPLTFGNDKSSYLPYIKNWISAYNKRFGIEKHSGLEPHQFVLEDANARRLAKELKEVLLKVLKFYENLKVYSLSEIEREVEKIQNMGAPQAPVLLDKQKGVVLPAEEEKPKQPVSTQKLAPIIPLRVEVPPIESRMKIMDQNFSSAKEGVTNAPKNFEPEKEIPAATSIEIENGHLLELLKKYPDLKDQKISNNSIRLATAPFSITPTIANWIDFYYKECGKGSHSPQERDSFIERMKTGQSLSQDEIKNLSLIFKSLDEKTSLPYDAKNGSILFSRVSVGNQLKVS